MNNAIENQVLTKTGSLFVEESTLVFVMEGRLTLRFGKEEFIAEKNSMVFLRKNILVGYSAVAGVSCTRMCLKQDLVKEFVKLTQLNVAADKETLPVTVSSSINTHLSRFIDSLQPYLAEPEKMEAPLTRIKLLELLFNIARFDRKVLVQLMDLRQQFRADITLTVERNIMNSLSLNQLAELSGRSLSSFRRDFFAIYNMPPSQWIRQKRLEKARELLLNTTMTVTDVCYTIGFENLPHFSRLFKSHFGHPPSTKNQLYV